VQPLATLAHQNSAFYPLLFSMWAVMVGLVLLWLLPKKYYKRKHASRRLVISTGAPRGEAEKPLWRSHYSQ
jgi:hypothetical protein